MLNLNKTAAAVLALGIVGSSAAIAGTMGPVCTPGNVTVPCERTAWDFGVYALYLQPTYNANMGYAGANSFVTTGVDSVEFDNEFNEANPRYGWGFKLEGSYHFNTGNDLNLNWYHYNKTTDKDFVVNPFVDPLLLDTSFESKWDAVNLELGQHIDVSENKKVRLFAGVQYARIQNEADAAAFINVGADEPLVVAAGNTMKFNGAGPRVGIDMMYDFGNGFAIYGTGATALLVGTSSFDNGAVAIFPTDPETTVAVFNHGSKNAVVPEVEAKLGAKYTYAMAQGDISLDGGWMVANYFNAQHTGVSVLGLPVTVESDFAINGPYLGLKWVGNV